MRRPAAALTLAAGLALGVGACATDQAPVTAADSASPSAAAVELGDAPSALVSRQDLPRLAGQLTTLSADDLAGEAGEPELATKLEEAGFIGAVSRDLRGRSRDVAGADSRVLVFSDASGAESFLDVVAADPDPFFGGPATVRRLSVAGSDGVLIKPPMCACPGAQPVYVGLVTAGNRLLWLQITGAGASPADVRRLLSGPVAASR